MKASKIFSRLIRPAAASLLIAALVGAASCTRVDDPIPTPEPLPATYTIKGQVYNQRTNAVLPGVTVTMGTKTATTDSFGKFEFANLTTAGKYNIVLTKADFFPATYSLEFPVAAPNHALVFSLTMTMVPYVPGITPLDPTVGGTIAIEGGANDATLTMPSGTTVKDANNVAVTGPILITAVEVDDIYVQGVVNSPGIMTLRFEPSGYVFSKPLVLAIENPLTNWKYAELQLEFFNSFLGVWEIQATPVTYSLAPNDYLTSITHFSLYKVSFESPMVDAGTTVQPVKVLDSLMINRGLTAYNQTAVRYIESTGYKFETPLATTLTAAGITGADQTELIASITALVKANYNGVAAVTTFGTKTTTDVVVRTIPSMFYQETTATQDFKARKFTIKLTNTAGTVNKTLEIVTIKADMITLSYNLIVYDGHAHSHLHGHDHGLGGGGTI
ncbi:MAG: hypothetical protein ACD_77C00345G0005 [uncultured bacterium]|nr:MAG: hypothetical protein ACD_77C00345G0005 [uncultured bacterium]